MPHVHARVEDGDVDEAVVRGRGRGVEQAKEGTGLRGMRERAAAFGGSIWFGPVESGGTEVKAELPIGGDA